MTLLKLEIAPSDILSSVSILLAAIAFIYSYLTNTKKYELKYQYRCEVLDWFSGTVKLLIQLKHECKDGFNNVELKRDLLSELSSKIELGRFYFPNIDTGNGFGNDKPEAYKGYRNLILDFLVYSYMLFDRPTACNYLHHATILQRHFTSELFGLLDPHKFLKETEKVTNSSFRNGFIFEDFLSKEPELIREYLSKPGENI